MDIASLRGLLLRDLRALRREIEAYPDDESPWQRLPGLPNAAGNLALHLAGNLRHYIGARLGGSGYVRDREAEFSRRGLPRDVLCREVDDAIAVVDRTLAGLGAAQLDRTFPEPVGGWNLRTGEFLLHLAAHLGYHLGQIDYHRRVVTGDPRTAGAMAVGELPAAKRAL